MLSVSKLAAFGHDPLLTESPFKLRLSASLKLSTYIMRATVTSHASALALEVHL